MSNLFEKLFKFPLDEFGKGTFRLGSRLPVELALLAVAAAVFAAIYFYRRAPGSLGRRKRTLLSVLRGVALGLLVLILFQPVLKVPQPVTKDCYVVVLADNSGSMKIDDAGAKGARADKDKRKSRLAVLKDVLGTPGEGSASSGKPGLVEELAEVCPVRMFKFGREVERITDIGDLNGIGDRTNLFKPLKAVDTELRGVPVVGVIVFTDGAANDGGDPREIARMMKTKDRPIWCVGVGDPNPPKDLEVIRVQAPRVVRANTNVEIYANVRCTGFQEPFDVILRQEEKVRHSKEVQPVKDDQDNKAGKGPAGRVYRIPLSFQPADRGTFHYTVEIPYNAEEVIRDNNRYEFVVRVADQRLPVLYLEGSPREEYRFLRRALFRDKDFRIVSILRLVNAKAGEAPKKKGIKKFITQGAEPEDGLTAEDEKDNGYPKTKKHLYRFEAIIFGDIPANYLTKEQLQITEEFVRKRGGGFLMLGGVNSFNLGEYQGTVIEKMLPVVLPAPAIEYVQKDLEIFVTEAGLKHPIMRQTGGTGEADDTGIGARVNRSLWNKAPKLIGYNPITDFKPAAELLALGRATETETPLLVVQKYGAGRTAAFTTGGSWHWQMARPKEDELHEKFWKQLVRWMALGSKAKLTIELKKDIFALKESVVIRCVVLDHAHKPVDDAKVVATVENPFGVKRKLNLEWILSEEGVYQTQYTPIDEGDYKIDVKATLKDEAKTELETTATFSVGQTLDEYNDVSQKVDLLKEIAENSGGKYYRPDEVNEIVRTVKKRVRKMKRDETVFEQHDIWDTPLLFALLALALSVEWIIRRRAGLM